MLKILTIVGTRPNFIKITQFKKVAAEYPNLELKIAHTGQHHKKNMADVFFQQFNLTPDFFLEVPPGSSNSVMAGVMTRSEKVINEYQSDLILVTGDVNSTLAAALTANKMGIKLGHVESGLRSGDRTMPEEINRILTDQISDYLFVTEQSGSDNLYKEGVKGQIHFVGNTMIDTLVAFDKQIQSSKVLENLQLKEHNFILMTMHRPATVDNPGSLKKLVLLINKMSEEQKIVFPAHPRTVDKLKNFDLFDQLSGIPNLVLSEPMDYFSFQKLINHAKAIITDSGGIQEESTFRKVPCLTLRNSTERPSTINTGSNELINFDPEILIRKIRDIDQGKFKKGNIPPLWDGRASERIFEIISKL